MPLAQLLTTRLVPLATRVTTAKRVPHNKLSAVLVITNHLSVLKDKINASPAHHRLLVSALLMPTTNPLPAPLVTFVTQLLVLRPHVIQASSVHLEHSSCKSVNLVLTRPQQPHNPVTHAQKVNTAQLLMEMLQVSSHQPSAPTDTTVVNKPQTGRSTDAHSVNTTTPLLLDLTLMLQQPLVWLMRMVVLIAQTPTTALEWLWLNTSMAQRPLLTMKHSLVRMVTSAQLDHHQALVSNAQETVIVRLVQLSLALRATTPLILVSDQLMSVFHAHQVKFALPNLLVFKIALLVITAQEKSPPQINHSAAQLRMPTVKLLNVPRATTAQQAQVWSLIVSQAPIRMVLEQPHVLHVLLEATVLTLVCKIQNHAPLLTLIITVQQEVSGQETVRLDTMLTPHHHLRLPASHAHKEGTAGQMSQPLSMLIEEIVTLPMATCVGLEPSLQDHSSMV